MKKTLTLLLSGLLLLFLFPSCYYDNVEDLYPFPSASCDTSNVTYSATISPIMAANCNVCHTAGNANADVITDTYAGLSIVSNNGLLWKAVSHDPGVVPMPYQASQLSDCDLRKINTWILGGSKNN